MNVETSVQELAEAIQRTPIYEEYEGIGGNCGNVALAVYQIIQGRDEFSQDQFKLTTIERPSHIGQYVGHVTVRYKNRYHLDAQGISTEQEMIQFVGKDEPKSNQPAAFVSSVEELTNGDVAYYNQERVEQFNRLIEGELD
jgi:hypothetical protein